MFNEMSFSHLGNFNHFLEKKSTDVTVIDLMMLRYRLTLRDHHNKQELKKKIKVLEKCGEDQGITENLFP